MHQQSIYCLSKGHPLNAEPMKPWPWKVLIGYRALGNRKVVATRSIHVRAEGTYRQKQPQSGKPGRCRHW